MLTTDMRENQTKSIEIKEFEHTVVEQFLEYVYTLEISAKASKTLQVAHLWALGDKYMVPGLVAYVEGLRKDCITLKNVVDLFVHADAFEATPIRDTCLAILAKNFHHLEAEIGELPSHVQLYMFRQLSKFGVSA